MSDAFGLKTDDSSVKPFPTDYNSIKVGRERLKNDVTADVDAIIDSIQSRKPIKKEDVENAFLRNDLRKQRAISEFFFRTNGIYSRLCRYMAYLFKYDWIVTPIRCDEKVPDKKVIEGWIKSLLMLENCSLKETFGEIALKVMKRGCYYGYIIRQKDAVYLQELPIDFCRSRYSQNGMKAIEFNVKYFDENFKDLDYRMRVVKMFPKEIQKAYVAYKTGKLPKDVSSDDLGWTLLDPEMTVKFNLSNSDAPVFINVIPALMDLDDAQDLDKKKMAQQLIRIIVQKLPMKKDGDSVFDFAEAGQIHRNAVSMVGKAIGVNVLTTFADVEVADMSDKGNVSSVDQLDKVERTVYNEAGVSQMQFNSSGNIALEKSILNDEATLSNLIDQFKKFGQRILKPMNKSKNRLYFEFSILPTTIYNYKDLAKMYKEQVTIGYSLLLPQVALGRSQLSVFASAVFENKIMNLTELFVPPQMSSTVSNNGDKSKNQDKTVKKTDTEEKSAGRPELPDDEKSEKTMQNIESAS